MSSAELPYGLQPVTDDMTPDERCAIGVGNMQRLIDMGAQARLALGEELAALKSSGDWRADPEAGKCRTWDQYVCTMQWPAPVGSTARNMTPKDAERLISGFKDHLLREHLKPTT